MLYKRRYRIQSIRLSNWDYRSPGWYFITICVNQRWTKPFGHIKNGFVCVSDIGAMAHQYWQDIPNHFPNVSLDTFVVMPDHVHGIIHILPDNLISNEPVVVLNDSVGYHDSVETCHGMSLRNDHVSQNDHVSPNGGALQNHNPHIIKRQYNQFSKPIKQSLPMIINQYKSAVTRWCRKQGYGFQWQPRYYEKIIRSQQELYNVRRYIQNNPKVS